MIKRDSKCYRWLKMIYNRKKKWWYWFEIKIKWWYWFEIKKKSQHWFVLIV